jgi:hypothetical protein
MTRDTDPASESSAANGRELIVPVAMSAALTGICEVFETMFGAHVTVHGKPRAFCADGLGYGLYLSLLRGHGSWELGLFGEKKTCENLATALLGLSPDEQPQTDDVVDLLGEVVNMVSGIVKSSVRGGADIHFGIPLQLSATTAKPTNRARFRSSRSPSLVRTSRARSCSSGVNAMRRRSPEKSQAISQERLPPLPLGSVMPSLFAKSSRSTWPTATTIQSSARARPAPAC